MDDLHDTERPTPREPTGSWEALRAEALDIARRLEHAAMAKRSTNAMWRDPEGAGRMAERASVCRWLGEQFSLWPSNPEKWSLERVTLGPFFTGLYRVSLEELGAMRPRGDGGRW